MKKTLTILTLWLMGLGVIYAQCSTTNATSCQCENPNDTDCDLLPDITISPFGFWNEMGGPTEYPQVCNPPCNGNDGRLRITASTPNIGFGPLTVGAVAIWVCGTDTFYNTAPANCPNGSAPRQLIKQKIYHKNGNTMTYWERWAGAMTYHPTHGHMHVDDWEIMTLRIKDPSKPDPRDWPIVGTGSKLGFCLMDYGSCNTYNGHCTDSLGNTLTSVNFPNYQLGGGQYNCSPVEQGISSGYTDIYHENLDGMWIDIPPGTCNGTYWVVLDTDPHNALLESKENNNLLAVEVTLTNQVPAGQGNALIQYNGPKTVCAGESVVLNANVGSSYLWSDGSTSQSLTATTTGDYYVTVTSPCGIATSDTLHLTFENASAPLVQDVDLCGDGSATLSATAPGTINWYDSPTATSPIGTGSSFTTPILSTTTTYYVQNVSTIPPLSGVGGPVDGTFGTGAYHTNNTRYQMFDVHQPCVLKSVTVDANQSGNRTVTLSDANGTVLDSIVVNIPTGLNVVSLNFNLQPGTDYRLGLSATSSTNLYRNSASVTYPYEVDPVNHFLTITNSSAGSQYYYFYYNWEVEGMPKTCEGPLTPVSVNINTIPTASISNLPTTILGSASAITLTATPAGGTFSGSGVSNGVFDPMAVTHNQSYLITYTYTSPQGCEAIDTQSVFVSYGTGIENPAYIQDFVVYPNPNNGNFRIQFSANEGIPVNISLYNVAGQKIWSEKHADFVGLYSQDVAIENQASGVYFMEVNVKGVSYRLKVMKE